MSLVNSTKGVRKDGKHPPQSHKGNRNRENTSWRRHSMKPILLKVEQRH